MTVNRAALKLSSLAINALLWFPVKAESQARVKQTSANNVFSVMDGKIVTSCAYKPRSGHRAVSLG
ncbi:exported hypothetical protein [Candidatus Nitrospira nitrificans]|uniref:Uncharacterized protein n=1 Tax=Candidatus Nitrospira nitrificans TaxID=1742973 RepID=A0A0S4LUN8_9BACT|nr:exported hypothetical protein [Candidatus Nitrospira nitrificans]